MSRADVELAAEAVRLRIAGRHLLLLSDFDGTLAEFNPNPEDVWLSAKLRADLERIVQHGATVALVSGRRLDDVRRRAALGRPAYYAGLHGLEIEGPGASFRHPVLARGEGLLRELESVLRPALAQLPGVFLEDKGVALVAHYRAASEEDGERAQEVLLRHARAGIDSGILRVMQGACVLELLPDIQWDKGSAVMWITEQVSREHSNVWPLYIGDDTTDEDACRAVAGSGLSIAASARVTGADFAVDGPIEVAALLHAIAEVETPAMAPMPTAIR